MQLRPDPKGMAVFLRGPDARRVTTLAAGAGLARARGLVGRDSGETAASGHLEHGMGGDKQDRVRASVVFAGAAVYQQFTHTGTRFLTRAFEGQ